MRPVSEQSQTSQRVKVGMIGLAAVVLLIAIASAILGSAARDRPQTAAVQANIAMTNADDTAEPLSDLGVAPSTGNDQAPEPQP